MKKKKKKNSFENKFCVAPMLNYTDEHCCYFYRQLTKKTYLYTEMMTTKEILNNTKNIKKYKPHTQKPIAIQIAGNNIYEMSKCAKLAYQIGFKEINLNIGCPSKKAQLGNFGACLMLKPLHVYNLIKYIYYTVPIKISLKIRIGLKNYNNYKFLYNFIKKTSYQGYCSIFIIHARIADLNEKNTKKNLKIPCLKYKYVYQIKKDFPKLKIILNGGIKDLLETKKHLKKIDGVMIGRAITKNPLILSNVDKEIFDIKKKNILNNALYKIKNYININEKKNISKIKILRHILNIFNNTAYAKKKKKNILWNLKVYKNTNHLFKKILNFISKNP